jgi:hypothetical protein
MFVAPAILRVLTFLTEPALYPIRGKQAGAHALAD